MIIIYFNFWRFSIKKMLYEERVKKIDSNYSLIKLFDKDTLFLNIYFFGVSNIFVSMYYIWQLEALTRLKENLRKKWVDDLPNSNLFIEGVEKRDRTINPCYFVDDSESYFEKLFLWKIEKEDLLIQTRHFIQQRRHKKVYGKPLRKPFR